MAANLPSFSLLNFTLLKQVKSQGSYGFLITKELIFSGFQILDFFHFSASLISRQMHDNKHMKILNYSFNRFNIFLIDLVESVVFLQVLEKD